MLAGDADRDRSADVLKDAFVDGRLTREEYEDRIERVLGARTYHELDLLTADVPRPAPPFRPAKPGRTNSYAVASLACGIAGTFLAVPAVPAVVLGHMARRQIRRTGEDGDSMAVGGLVLGYTVCAAALAFIGLVVAIFAVAAA